MRRPSRLYRTFKPGAAGLFEIAAGDATYTDHGIQSVAVTRGAPGAAPTVTPSTVEFTVPGAVSIPRDTPLAIRLTPEFASTIAAGTGISADSIRDRFNGRKALVDVDDERWSSSLSSARFTSTITGSSWTAVMRGSDRTINATTGNNVASIIVNALRHPALESLQPVFHSNLSNFDTLAEGEFDLFFDDVMSKYAEALHIHVQHRRDGSVFVRPLSVRRTYIESAGPVWTALRAHTLAPARWSSPSEVATTQFRLRYRDADGSGPWQVDWPISEGVSPVSLRTELVDLAYVLRETENVGRAVASRNMTTNISRQGVESITFDLRLLHRMGTTSARRTIAEVLALNEGDPVQLGADWPVGVRGPYFATQIRESIAPDGWTITLALQHARYVLGLGDDELTTPRPLAWDAASTTWDTTPGTWG